jgi:hypothetical protein
MRLTAPHAYTNSDPATTSDLTSLARRAPGAVPLQATTDKTLQITCIPNLT